MEYKKGDYIKLKNGEYGEVISRCKLPFESLEKGLFVENGYIIKLFNDKLKEIIVIDNMDDNCSIIGKSEEKEIIEESEPEEEKKVVKKTKKVSKKEIIEDSEPEEDEKPKKEEKKKNGKVVTVRGNKKDK